MGVFAMVTAVVGLVWAGCVLYSPLRRKYRREAMMILLIHSVAVWDNYVRVDSCFVPIRSRRGTRLPKLNSNYQSLKLLFTLSLSFFSTSTFTSIHHPQQYHCSAPIGHYVVSRLSDRISRIIITIILHSRIITKSHRTVGLLPFKSNQYRISTSRTQAWYVCVLTPLVYEYSKLTTIAAAISPFHNTLNRLRSKISKWKIHSPSPEQRLGGSPAPGPGCFLPVSATTQPAPKSSRIFTFRSSSSSTAARPSS